MDISAFGTLNALKVCTSQLCSGNLGNGVSRDLTLKASDATGASTVTSTLKYATPAPTLTFSLPSLIKNLATPVDDTDAVTKAFVTVHTTNVQNPHNVTKAQVGLSQVQNIKQNFTATVAPSVTNDSADGYSVGSQWVNTADGTSYVCVSATNGNAVWNSNGTGQSITSYFDKSSIVSYTNSTIYVQSGVSITPASGTYNIIATVTFSCSTNNGSIALALAVAGTVINESQIVMRQSQSTTGTTQYIVTVNGSQTVTLMYMKYSGTGNVRLNSKNLIGLKLS